jgi:hypothetical protein
MVLCLRADLNDPKEIIMANHVSTTPMSVFKTPIPDFDAMAQAAIPANLLTSLTTFDVCLALVSRSITANADVAGWIGDPALRSFSVEAADAEACANMALEAFCYQPGCDPDLWGAAWLLLLLLADDGRDLAMLSDRCVTLRHTAFTCASVVLPGNSYKSGRMWVAADLLEQLIAVAQDDIGTSDMNADGLRAVGIRPATTDIDRIDTFSNDRPDSEPEPYLEANPMTDCGPDFGLA